MAQYAWVAEVMPGYEEEYRRRHEEISGIRTDPRRGTGTVNLREIGSTRRHS